MMTNIGISGSYQTEGVDGEPESRLVTMILGKKSAQQDRVH